MPNLREDSGPTLNILRVSLAIYRDSMPFLYRFSTFVFSYKKFFRYHCFPSRISFERVTHIEIRLDCGPHMKVLNLTEGFPAFQRFCEVSLGPLALVERNRKRLMSVTLRMDPAVMAYEDFDKIQQIWPDEPLAPGLCALVGFRAVIVEWHHCCDCTMRRELPDAPNNPSCKIVLQLQEPGNPLWKRLEKVLGPGGVEDVSLWNREEFTFLSGSEILHDYNGYYNCHRRRWVFDPRAFEEGDSMPDLGKLLINRHRCADCNHSHVNLHLRR